MEKALDEALVIANHLIAQHENVHRSPNPVRYLSDARETDTQSISRWLLKRFVTGIHWRAYREKLLESMRASVRHDARAAI